MGLFVESGTFLYIPLCGFLYSFITKSSVTFCILCDDLYVSGGPLGRRGGFIVTALAFRLSGPGLSPGRGHCAGFLGKTLYSHQEPSDVLLLSQCASQVYK